MGIRDTKLRPWPDSGPRSGPGPGPSFARARPRSGLGHARILTRPGPGLAQVGPCSTSGQPSQFRRPSAVAADRFRRQRVLVASLLAENRKIRPEMAVLRAETRPDGPGRSGSSLFWPDPAKLT